MFTGIIEGLGTITGIHRSGQGKHIAIDSEFVLDNTKIGDSIAVSGACLTAVVVAEKKFEVDVAPETLSKSVLGNAKIGDFVNLERALRFSDRLDGHLVSGHIDGMGLIKARKILSNAIIITIGAKESLGRYMIQKGSVAVDGVSLTINKCSEDSFEVSIIPHTAKLTTIGFKKVGDPVNIETDMIGKYVERFLHNNTDNPKAKEDKSSTLNMQFLAESGFL
jgi:riboflavin synthase